MTTAQMPMIRTPDITSRAMLVSLRIAMWQGRKYDKEVSRDIEEQYDAEYKSGRYNKLLVPKESFKDITSVASEARLWHYRHTLPWFDDGDRILASEMFLEYTQALQERKNKFIVLVDTFVDRFPEFVEIARRTRGKLFKEEDYPSPERIRRKFAFDVHFKPIPDKEDFRVTGLDQEQIKQIQKQTDEYVKKAIDGAVRDVWQRLFDQVKYMRDKLASYAVDPVTGKKTNWFRDSLVGNLQDLVGLLPKLNVTGDANLEAMRRELATSLCANTPNDLRASETLRINTRKKADDLLAKMSTYLSA